MRSRRPGSLTEVWSPEPYQHLPAKSRRCCTVATPESLRLRHWVDLMLLPPYLFVALIMQGAVMQPAERHRECIAGLEPKPARFEEFEVMGLGGQPPAYETGLLRDAPQMRLVANPARS